MSMTLKDKLICYIYNKMNTIDADREQIKYTMRYRPADSLDMYETMREQVRCEVWDEFLHDLYNLVFNTSYRDKNK